MRIPKNREEFEYDILTTFKIAIEETCDVSGIVLSDEDVDNMIQNFAKRNKFKKYCNL